MRQSRFRRGGTLLVATIGLVLSSSVASVAFADDESTLSGADAADSAIAATEEALPPAVAPSPEVTGGVSPTTSEEGDALVVDGALIDGVISTDPAEGFTLGTSSGALELKPVGVADDAPEADLTAGGDVAVFADTQPGVDTIVRPVALGIETFNTIEDAGAPHSFSWTVDLPGDEELYELEEGGVAVLAPVEETDPGTSLSDEPPAEDDADPAELSLPQLDGSEGDAGGVISPGLPDGMRMVAKVGAPVSIDANGQYVDSSFVVDGDTVTMTVAPKDSALYPIVADPAWLPTGDIGGGWYSYGADYQLLFSSLAYRGHRGANGLCHLETEDPFSGGASHGIINRELARQVGAGDGCLSVIERGAAWPFEYEAWQANATNYSMFTGDFQTITAPGDVPQTLANMPTHKQRGLWSTYQEDPVGINVNGLHIALTWTFKGHRGDDRGCVLKAFAKPRTEQYEPTGWDKVAGNQTPLDDEGCQRVSKTSYAKFEGGELFPACAGRKVTTFYNSVAVANRNGNFRGFVHRETGGAPCADLLHFEEDKSNVDVE